MVENTHWLNIKEWTETCEKWWFCFLHYGGGVNLGKIFGLINDADYKITSLVQDVGTATSLGM